MSSLPAPLTQFIGRQRERQEAARLLADPACRLLTLVGPGGMGKTRLAIALAHQLRASFADGVVFVPLQAVVSADWLIAAVAEALDVPLAGQGEPLAQLGSYLGGEWIYPLNGLQTPAGPELDAWETYDAVALFGERARQVRWDFSPADEAEHVIEICRLTEGMPLGLELAASWLRPPPAPPSPRKSGTIWTFSPAPCAMCRSGTAACAPFLPTRGKCCRRTSSRCLPDCRYFAAVSGARRPPRWPRPRCRY